MTVVTLHALASLDVDKAFLYMYMVPYGCDGSLLVSLRDYT